MEFFSLVFFGGGESNDFLILLHILTSHFFTMTIQKTTAIHHENEIAAVSIIMYAYTLGISFLPKVFKTCWSGIRLEFYNT